MVDRQKVDPKTIDPKKKSTRNGRPKKNVDQKCRPNQKCRPQRSTQKIRSTQKNFKFIVFIKELIENRCFANLLFRLYKVRIIGIYESSHLIT